MTNEAILKVLYRVNDRFDVLFDADEATKEDLRVQAELIKLIETLSDEAAA
jgi:hypothetical protein